MMIKLATLVAASALVSSFASANAINFRVGAGSPAAQVAQVESDAQFENFTGRTAAVTGSMVFDPAKRTGSAKLTVDATKIDTGIPLRNDHMYSPDWMDTAKYGTITFETTNVKFVRGDQYDITGKFTMKGVTRTVTTRATVKYLKESAATRGAGFKGDVLQVRAAFNVKLADYNVKISDRAKGKVAETVRISLSAYGMSGS